MLDTIGIIPERIPIIKRLDEIKILPSFQACPPKNYKLASKREYYFQHGVYDRQLIIDPDGWLVDGYATYLVMRENGEISTDVEISYRILPCASFSYRDGHCEWRIISFQMARKLVLGDRVLLFQDGRFCFALTRHVNMYGRPGWPCARGIRLRL